MQRQYERHLIVSKETGDVFLGHGGEEGCRDAILKLCGSFFQCSQETLLTWLILFT